MLFGRQHFTQHWRRFSLRDTKRIPNQTAEGDSDKEVADGRHVEETFVAEEDRQSPEEASQAEGERNDCHGEQ